MGYYAEELDDGGEVEDVEVEESEVEVQEVDEEPGVEPEQEGSRVDAGEPEQFEYVQPVDYPEPEEIQMDEQEEEEGQYWAVEPGQVVDAYEVCHEADEEMPWQVDGEIENEEEGEDYDPFSTAPTAA